MESVAAKKFISDAIAITEFVINKTTESMWITDIQKTVLKAVVSL